jgi:hypothetical protein
MKRVIFSSLLIAGIFVSLSSFAVPSYGHGGWGGHAGYVYHGGYVVRPVVHVGFGYAVPRVYYPPVAMPIVYGAPYPPIYNPYPAYYGHPRYVRTYYRRPYCRRW